MTRAAALTTGRHKLPHRRSLRHTTAIHLLKARVGFATIRQWLSHASLNTTMRYARADLDLKRQALPKYFRKPWRRRVPGTSCSIPSGCRIAATAVTGEQTAWNAINYDIDLGHFYTWRWNISADFDADGKLRPAYLNGDPVLEGGSPKKIVSKVAEEGKEASIYRVQRPRPKAFKGGKSLGCLLFDRDGDLKTTNDQATAGGGPTRPPRASLD